MEETTKKEIERLKEQIRQKRQEIDDLNALVGEKIDREFPPDIHELSERELDRYLSEFYLSFEAFVEAKAELIPIASRRRILGRLIVSLKRALLTTAQANIDILLDRQIQLSQRTKDFLRAFLLRQQRQNEKIKTIEARVSACEEMQAVLMSRLKDLERSLEGSRKADK